MMKKEKFNWVDVSRGIGILLVVLSHAVTKSMAADNVFWWWMRELVFLFNMPIFFLIGGFLFEMNKGKYSMGGGTRYLKNKAKVYLIPYITFSVICYAAVWLLSHIKTARQILAGSGYDAQPFTEFLVSIATLDHPIDGHLWFSYVMLVVLVVMFYLMKIDDRILLTAFYCGYVLTWFFSFPELVWKTLRYLLLFEAGRIVYRNQYELFRVRWRKLIFAFGGFFAVWLVFRANKIYIPRGFVQPFVEVLSSLLFMKLAYSLNHKKLKEILTYIGKKSYPIYLIHQPYVVAVVLAVLLKLSVPIGIAVLFSVGIGVIIPILIDNLIIEKSKILKTLLLGGH